MTPLIFRLIVWQAVAFVLASWWTLSALDPTAVGVLCWMSPLVVGLVVWIASQKHEGARRSKGNFAAATVAVSLLFFALSTWVMFGLRPEMTYARDVNERAIRQSDLHEKQN